MRSGVNHAAVLRVLGGGTARMYGGTMCERRFMKERHALSSTRSVRVLPFHCRNRYLTMCEVLAVGGDGVLLCGGLLQR